MFALYNHRFSSADACHAAEIDMATLKNWITRDAILLRPEDREVAGKREFFNFSFSRVMQIALTAQLVKLGFSPKHGSVLALGFTDVGEGSGGWVGESEPKIVRLPGGLYPAGHTILIARPGSDSSEVRSVTPGEAWDPFYDSAGGLGEVAALINVSRVYWRVLQRLGFDRNGDPLPGSSR